MIERLKQIRKNINLSQVEFAKYLGISHSTLAMMEVGKRDILDRHVKTICSIFKINEEWFRTGEGEMYISLTEDEQVVSILSELPLPKNKEIRKIIKKATKLNENDLVFVHQLIDRLLIDK